ncbi:MAG: FAD-dependent oxidoreductase, partial [Sedimenticola sp.]|nr:FAD-dependent oxidoreductase [Sedimenticola sp.]
HGVRFVKGSHIVVPRLFEHDYPYIFQHTDGRVLFAIPFEKHYTLLGTTDIELDELPSNVAITRNEIDYICNAISEYFKQPIKPEQVIWSFSGVRPLYDDAASNASKVTRDYNLHLDKEQAPILSIYGGKITAFRKLAEEVMDLLSECIKIEGSAWTAESHLPGGDITNYDFKGFIKDCTNRYPWMNKSLLESYAGHYGTGVHTLLKGCASEADLGRHFGGQLYEKEACYLKQYEYAESADDILWRRTKRGLRLSTDEIKQFSTWLKGSH